VDHEWIKIQSDLKINVTPATYSHSISTPTTPDPAS